MSKLVDRYYIPDITQFCLGFKFQTVKGWQKIQEGALIPSNIEWIEHEISLTSNIYFLQIQYLINCGLIMVKKKQR